MTPVARPFDARLPFVVQLFARRFATVYDAAKSKRRLKRIRQLVLPYVALAVCYSELRPKQHVYLEYAELDRLHE